MPDVKSMDNIDIIIPEPLRPGDTVSLISPSYFIEKEKVERAELFLEQWGLKVKRGKNLLKKYGPFAGTDEERVHDLQEALDDSSVKAVFCSRGGYGLLRIIDRIDFSGLRVHPKWFIGYSDITVLHLWISKFCGVVTLHAEMPVHFGSSEKSPVSFSTLREALFEGRVSLQWEGRTSGSTEAEGILTGGNLSLLYSLMGTPGEPDTGGKILFIEDDGEYYHGIDRMLTSLRLAGKLENLAGLVVGGMTGIQEGRMPWGRTIRETVSDIVKKYNYPVFFDCPAGHIYDNRALMMGCKAKLAVKGPQITITFRG